MKRRVAWMGALLALGFAADSGAQARLVPGTSNSLPQLVSRHGTFALGKKPYPKGTRDQWLAEGRALAKAPDGYFDNTEALLPTCVVSPNEKCDCKYKKPSLLTHDSCPHFAHVFENYRDKGRIAANCKSGANCWK